MTDTVFASAREQEDVKALYLHDKAGETIRAMFEHVEQIHTLCGEREYRKAVSSLHHCLANMLRRSWSNEAMVTKDGNLGLLVQEGDRFVFGIVWFRDRSKDGTALEGVPGEWSCHS